MCERLVIMREIIWGWLSSALGLAVLVLLFVYGMQSGTWLDEVGSLRVSPPTFMVPFAIGGLGVVLFLGGLIIGLVATGERAQQRR
ncbi:hypothetical protein SAMN04489740_2818 [Arthrobacter alpinus]|uniref:DUF3955 domain-containing protein n=2 Tax=Arthrobacter alpinus TaxID=656366 RepID=A0A1H5MB08_9MICC|nr:hypothetical protein SAMN04489740_2818 [Arthrobacter alpinus]